MTADLSKRLRSRASYLVVAVSRETEIYGSQIMNEAANELDAKDALIAQLTAERDASQEALASVLERLAVGIEMAAQCAAKWRDPNVIRLAAGEMTAQEMRTAQAVAGGIEAAIRALPTADIDREALVERVAEVMFDQDHQVAVRGQAVPFAKQTGVARNAYMDRARAILDHLCDGASGGDLPSGSDTQGS